MTVQFISCDIGNIAWKREKTKAFKIHRATLFFFNKIVHQCTKQLLLKEQIISKKPENNHFQWERMYYIPRCSFEVLFFCFFCFFLIATRRTLLYKARRTLLTIPPTRRYLFYLLYNTSLDCNSYPTFYSFFFFAYTPMYLLNYNSKWVSI